MGKKKQDFNVFVGAETGILKGINLNPKAVINKNFTLVKKLEREHEITAMSWGGEQQDEVLLGLRNQTVSVFDTGCNSIVSSRPVVCGTGPIVAVNRKDGMTITGVESGEVVVWRGFDHEVMINTLPHNNNDNNNNNEAANLSTFKQHPSNEATIATGGKENPLQLWDLTRANEPIFKSKNVPPDMLQLRVPVWVTDIGFLPDHHTIATCTRHKHVRLYDPRKQRRPLLTFEWEDSPIISLAPVTNIANQIVIGTAHGRMGRFDLRGKKPSDPVCVYKGFAGAVKDIAIHPTLPFVCSVSLDRYLRVHHLLNHKLLHKEYLKSRLNCVAVRSAMTLEDIMGPPPEKPVFKRFLTKDLDNDVLDCAKRKKDIEAI